MRPQDKNIMMLNLRTFLNKGDAGLQEHQTDILEAAASFLRLPNGATFIQQGRDDTQEQGVKKGDYFEAVSATGTGKTRAFGTMAKAMDVPTLIVTPRNVLNDQTKKEFCEEIGIPESKIAVYDGKQSVAERKRVLEGNPPPQFVITSYQSLPSLIERHELEVTNHNDVHYRPLVILDEVHEGQGPKTAAIINRLKNDVLVAGFTATDAGASQSIFAGQKPIFHLPITHAIERGVLCNGIRTGVIDVAIDEGWIENFRSTPKGSNYSREDVEKFARTPSVIEGALRFHLTHVDDELGRISRLPTVFYTQGVAAAREGAEEFNKKAKELGLDVKAAYVSGEMGQKEYKPILDKFKAGEIQAVFNDKLLGMGFDARNASICYSLQPSNVPDVVEQQLGRVGRRQGSDYRDAYGQDKVALAINVRGKGMNPVLFAQVLDSPSVYSRKVAKPVQFKVSASPSFASELPQGVEVHLDYNDMNAVLAAAKNEREDAAMQPPPFPKNWKSGNMLESAVGGDCTTYIKQFEALRAAKLAEGISSEDVQRDWVGTYSNNNNQPALFASPQAVERILAEKIPPAPKGWKSINMIIAEVGGSPNAYMKRFEALRAAKLAEGISSEDIQRNWVGTYSNQGKSGFFASPQAVEEILSDIAQKAQPAPENWKSANMLVAEVGGTTSTYNTQFEALRTAKLAEGIAPEEIQRDWVGTYSNYGKSALFASPQAVEKILSEAALKVQPAPENWKSIDTLIAEAGGGYSTYIKQFAALRTAKLAEGIVPEEVQRDWMGTYKNSSGKPGFFVSPQAVEKILSEKALKVQPPPENWKSANMLVAEAGGFPQFYIKQFEALRATKLAEGIAPEEVQRDWVGTYRNRGRPGTFVSPQAVEAILKQRENTPEIHFTETIEKRSIKPGSDHLKRTGRTRGRGEE